VIIGEGEITWVELLDVLEKKTALNSVNGLAYIDDKTIRINKDRAFADLANFPVLDWGLVNPPDYFQSLFSAKNMLYLYSGKGCPEQCTFCFNKGFNKCEYRKRPFEYCIKEIKFLIENTGLDGVHFADELWCRNKKEMIDNCDQLINNGFNIFWGCNARIGTFKKEDFEYMFRAGCRWMFFGVESGSEKIQKDIKKRILLDQVEETVNNCADAGITAITSFIIGFPDETPDDIKETIALAKKIPKAMYDFNLYFPISGSEMCDKLIIEGTYKLPETLEAFANLVPTERINNNFSKIPARDLMVIRAYFMWASFTRKNTSPDSTHYEFTKKAVSDALNGLLGHGIKGFVISLIYDAKTFLEIVFSLMFNPVIRKKYGLYKTK